MKWYLLDTNHIGVAVNARTDLALRIRNGLAQGLRFGTCLPVLCEIQAGRQQVSHPDEYQRNLQALLRRVRIWPLDEVTTELYGKLYALVRKRGRALSAVDLMAAALAQQHQCTILTTDRDFEAIEDVVSVDNWLVKTE
ncbi:MAG: type II toxin-antitoxin system VapC family toxin [Planctomycetaceae bacterium]|nr:type II toxin-antitoxin system VapC family toxin [Planctomycetaceae bacterium]